MNAPTDNSPVDSDLDAPDRFKERLELLIAAMLGLAAVLTAWSAFQSSQLGDKVQENYSEGIRLSDQASQEYNTAVATDNQDQALFLAYTQALVTKNEELAMYIHETLMSPALAAAVDWWAAQPAATAPDSPFVESNPEWVNDQWERAEEWEGDAQEFFTAAKKADNDGDEFDLLTVIVTLSLFLFGIAGLVRQRRIMIGLAALGGLILAYSIVQAVVLGDPASVF